ncbi:MAG: RNA polymerase subunit sigma-54, partial [Anaerovoracaceae bacterium]
MNEEFGIARVLEPRHAMPTSAWKLDNNRALREDELCVEIKTIHLDGTSFHQICLESNDNDELIKRKIIDIVIRRGKLHNPVTDTGGLAYGVVAEIGPKYKNKIGLQRGEEIICNASLASMPLY